MFQDPNSFYWLENITLIERNVMSLQKFNVLLLERFSAMVRLLIANVIAYATEIQMRNGKRTEAFLPRKPASDPLLLVDVIGRSGFDIADQICRSNAGFQAEQQVCVIRHAIDCDKLLTSSRHDSRDLFL